jgi:hypothetical protein
MDDYDTQATVRVEETRDSIRFTRYYCMFFRNAKH